MDRARGSLRPSSSNGRLSSSLPPIGRHQPPSHLLPPFPPPLHLSMLSEVLPELPDKRHQRRRTRPKRPPTPSSRPKCLVDASTDTRHLGDENRHICRLCGVDCLSGDILHAHILLLQHKSISPQETRLVCRQCGSDWCLEDDEKAIRRHPCLLQKAAYFKNHLAPIKSIRHGLPFVCLFCCPEPEVEDNKRRAPRRLIRKTAPLKRCQAACRFSSKLELAVHIRYIHDVYRHPGRCSECLNFVCEDADPPEIDFWEKSTLPEPETHRPPSTQSILYRDGLHPLEVHVQNTHTEGFEYLQWLDSKRHRCGPKDFTEKTLKSRTSWMYACPLCQIHSFKPTRTEAIHPEVGLPSNAALQAHIACFHSAGSSFLDWKLQTCSVCGDCAEGGTEQYKHLLTGDHISRLRDNYSRAERQGRVSGFEEVNWRSTCVLCWRRFEGPALLAECRLQAHLLSTHCIFNKAGEFNVLACGWCGGFRDGKNHESRTNRPSWRTLANRDEDPQNLRGLPRLQARRQRSRTNLFADFKWSQKHEAEHAEALFRWWRSNKPRSDTSKRSDGRRGLLWSRGSWIE